MEKKQKTTVGGKMCTACEVTLLRELALYFSVESCRCKISVKRGREAWLQNYPTVSSNTRKGGAIQGKSTHVIPFLGT